MENAPVLGAQILVDAMLEAHPLKARGRHDHTRILTVWIVHLGETSLDIAAEIGKAERRIEPAELR
jgi:hypothetical protein